jgi:hypothetical protein
MALFGDFGRAISGGGTIKEEPKPAKRKKVVVPPVADNQAPANPDYNFGIQANNSAGSINPNYNFNQNPQTGPSYVGADGNRNFIDPATGDAFKSQWQADMTRRLSEYSPDKRTSLDSPNKNISSGIMTGMEKSKSQTGLTEDQTGQGMKSTLDMQKALMEGKAPTQERIKQMGNEKKAEMMANSNMAGVRGGTAARNLSGIDRQTQMDISNQLYAQQAQATNQYQQAIGNVINLQNANNMGYAALFNNKPAQVVNPFQSNIGGTLGQVLNPLFNALG